MLQGICEVKTNDLCLFNSLFKNEVSIESAPSSNPTKGSSNIIKSELFRNTLNKANFFYTTMGIATIIIDKLPNNKKIKL